LNIFDAIQIGSMSVQLSPKGSPSFDSDLSNLFSPFNSLCNIENLNKIGKVCTGFNTVLVPGGSVLGLTPGRSRDQCAEAVLHGCSSVPASLTEQHGQGRAG
jgi:hypothetical protein